MTPHVRIVMLAATLGLLPACGGDRNDATSVPSAAELQGTYDVRITDPAGRTSTMGVGTVRSAGATSVTLALTEPPLELAGELADDGTITLTGQTTQTDAISFATVSGKFEVRDDTIHFVGVRAAEVSSPLEVVMDRRIDADLRHFAGAYRLAFHASPSGRDCGSSVTLDVAVDSTGIATVARADETCTDGTVVADLWHIGFAIAPSGRFQIEGTWELTDGSCPFFPGGPCLLLVDGTLAATGDPAATAVLLSGIRMQVWGSTVTLERVASLPE